MITNAQHKTLEFIREYIDENGLSPSFSDIADGLGLKSRGVVHRNVHALADAGLIEFTSGSQRKIQLVEERAESELPLLGQIAAGRPIEAIEDKQSIDVTEELAGDNRFALKVKGDSMIDVGIFDGDYVIIRSDTSARNGDIVVALIDNEEATLKRFKKLSNDKVELMPENPEMEPMVFHQSQVTIQGILVGQFRTY